MNFVKTKILFFTVIFCVITGCSKPIQWSAENVVFGIDERQTINIIFPEHQKEVHALVYIHGGFYYSGNKLWHPLFLTEYSEKNIFATIDYRLISPNNNSVHLQDMISDIHQALLKIQEISKENGIHIKDFILAGHSAGAHLALLYGYRHFQNNGEGINIAACVSLSGPTDYTDDFGWSSMSYYGADLETRLASLSYLGTELTGTKIDLEQYNWTEQTNYAGLKKFTEEISPVMYVHDRIELPPTLLVHGLDDRIVPYSNSIKLNNALNNTSVPHKLITVTGSGNNHMLGGNPSATNSTEPIIYTNQPWIDEVKEWLELHTGLVR